MLVEKDALMVNLREFTLMTFVSLEDTFMGGNLVKKTLLAGDDLPVRCPPAWHLSGPPSPLSTLSPRGDGGGRMCGVVLVVVVIKRGQAGVAVWCTHVLRPDGYVQYSAERAVLYHSGAGVEAARDVWTTTDGDYGGT
jgi:hypothetical protein